MLRYSDLQWKDGLDPRVIQLFLKEEAEKDGHKIAVLDDNPTGIQTVHDMPVYADWSYESIRQGFLEPGKMLFILTNPRSFSRPQATRARGKVGRRLAAASRELGITFAVVNRGDSILRGHFPLEAQTLRETLGEQMGEEIHGEVICPFFAEGGRFAMGNVHYVKKGEWLVPAGETEFVNDKTFGYCSSDLREYIEEKTGGTDKEEDAMCIPVQQPRPVDMDGAEQMLMNAGGFDKVVINALTPLEIKVLCIALYRAMAKGKRFLFSTAAGFVKEFVAVEDREFLTGRELVPKGRMGGGLVVVGSHTRRTIVQLECLRELPNIRLMEFDSDQVLDPVAMEEEIASVARREEACVRQGIAAVMYTK